MNRTSFGFLTFLLFLLLTQTWIIVLIGIIISFVAAFLFDIITGKHEIPKKSAVIITGCSKGIGLSAALTLANKGLVVFASVREEQDAQDIKAQSSNIIPIVMDIVNEEQVKKAAALVQSYIEKEKYTLIGLVNNAGLMEEGFIELQTLQQMKEMMEVNYFGHVIVTQNFLPLLRKYADKVIRPRIVYISSGVASCTTPFAGAYAASKNAIEGMADTLRMELRAWGIKVIVVEPGLVNTSMNFWIEINNRPFSRFHGSIQDKDLVAKYSKLLNGINKVLYLFAQHRSSTKVTDNTIESALLSRYPNDFYPSGKDVTLLHIFSFVPSYFYCKIWELSEFLARLWLKN